jgi:hypothetical protein
VILQSRLTTVFVEYSRFALAFEMEAGLVTFVDLVATPQNIRVLPPSLAIVHIIATFREHFRQIPDL